MSAETKKSLVCLYRWRKMIHLIFCWVFFFFFLKLAIEFLFEQIASQRNCDNFLQLRGLPTLGFMWSLSCVICLWRNAIFRANFKFFYHKAVVVSNTGSACVKRRIVIITTLKKPHNSIFSGSKISLKWFHMTWNAKKLSHTVMITKRLLPQMKVLKQLELPGSWLLI